MLNHILLMLSMTMLVDTCILRYHGYARFTWNFVGTACFTMVVSTFITSILPIWAAYAVTLMYNASAGYYSLRRDDSMYRVYRDTVYYKIDE